MTISTRASSIRPVKSIKKNNKEDKKKRKFMENGDRLKELFHADI